MEQVTERLKEFIAAGCVDPDEVTPAAQAFDETWAATTKAVILR